MAIPLFSSPARIASAFHKLYYRSQNWARNTYLGYPILQCPFDLQVYQQIIFAVRPRFIIQTGVARGGSVLFMATLLDLIGADPGAVVIGIDIRLSRKAREITHPRVRLVKGGSTDAATLSAVESFLPAAGGMVSLDSDHSAGHVLDELRLYRKYVAVGSYLVAEDTNVNGHPVLPDFGPGPFEAVDQFVREDPRFVRDDEVWRQNLFSFHQHGWLKRTS